MSFVECEILLGSPRGPQRTEESSSSPTESEGPGSSHVPANGGDTIDIENRQGSNKISTWKGITDRELCGSHEPLCASARRRS